jgi:hypothetical protein
MDKLWSLGETVPPQTVKSSHHYGDPSFLARPAPELGDHPGRSPDLRVEARLHLPARLGQWHFAALLSAYSCGGSHGFGAFWLRLTAFLLTGWQTPAGPEWSPSTKSRFLLSSGGDCGVSKISTTRLGSRIKRQHSEGDFVQLCDGARTQGDDPSVLSQQVPRIGIWSAPSAYVACH